MRGYLIVCTLFAALATLWPGLQPAAAGEQIRIGGTGASLEYSKVMARIYTEKTPGAEVTVREGLGSSGGIRAVIAGALDVAISGRPLKAKEASDGLFAVEIMKTPFGFFTSRREPVDVAASDVRQLYTHIGVPSEWFGGETVRIVLRPHSDSDLQLAGHYSEGLGDSMEAARRHSGIPIAQTDQDNAGIAENMNNSLTTGTLLQMVSENRNLRPLLIDGIAPTLETMRSGEYRFTKTLYLVHRESPSDAVRNFAAYLFSDEAVEVTGRPRTTTGICSSMSAMGPCFISPAA